MRPDEGVVDIFPVVHACCQPSEVEPFGAVRLRLTLLFGYSADRLERDNGFTSNFSHRCCRISLDAFFNELAVPCSVDCALSTASRTVMGVAELQEPFYGSHDIWKHDAKHSRNV